MIVDLFAGPGGWDTGARLAGYSGPLVGIEWDDEACRTAIAAGHPRLRADVSTFDATVFTGLVDGLIGSPPCQAWSMAGDRKGELDREKVFGRIAAFAANREPDETDWADGRSHLTAEPMRWAVALRPRWIACEQVPAVLPLWQYMAELLRGYGYKAWTGLLSAEEYGVPQTRKRAILVARLDGVPAGPPPPTHQPYRAGQQAHVDVGLFGDTLPPWVSMADALGWGLPERPAWTVTAGGTDTGGAEVFGNAKCRAELDKVALRSNYTDDKESGARTIRETDEPATTVTGRPGHWVMRNGNQARACVRNVSEPAGTVFFGHRANAVEFQEVEGEGRRRVSVEEAGVLQSFPSGYPWQGTKSAQYRQVGDAVPPRLAAAILRPLLHATQLETAA